MGISTGNDLKRDKEQQEKYGKKVPENASGLISLDGMTFGMPPGTHLSDSMMLNSMPTATIIPCEPEFSRGLSLFRLDQSKGMTEYLKILNSVGFTLSGNSIKVSYLADNFPTDTFNNEYGETFLDKFAQVASSGLGDMAQIMGWTNFSDAEADVGNLAEATGAGDMYESAIKSAKKAGEGASSKLSDRNRSRLSGAVDMMKSMVTGARVDFPQVWKNSSFTPSYSMTIRLYNPNPSDPMSTKKYIVGPIAALLALGLPKVAEDASTYKWPLLCKIRSPGIYHLNAAYINSIAIVKGGDQQSIAFNQSLAMCDVRIDFGSLYNSILAGPGTDELGYDRPTLGSYLEAIGGRSMTGSPGRRGTQTLPKSSPNESESLSQVLTKKHSAPIKQKDLVDPIKERTNDELKNIVNDLKDKINV